MAEAIARRLAAVAGIEGLEFRSAGTSTVPGLPASEGALRAALRHDLTLRDHVSNPLSRELVGWADLILTMGSSHLLRALEQGGEGKTALLGAFSQGLDDGMEPEVPDPYGGGDEVYEATFLTLEAMVTAALNRLSRSEER
jgi:protein-tyrosine phosphatase